MRIFSLFTLFIAISCTSLAQASPTSERVCPEAPSLRELMTISTTSLVDLTYEEEIKVNESFKTYFEGGKPFTGWAYELNVQTIHKFHFYQIVNGITQREVGYYGSGQIDFDFNFVDQKSDGCRLMWFEDGSIYIDEFYQAGIPHGRQLRFNQEGEVGRNELFKNGIRVEE